MAMALLAAANAAHHQREFERAISLGEEGLARAREVKEWALAADALQNLTLAAGYHGDHARARSSFTESLALAREMGDQRMMAWQLNNLGWTLRLEGDYETARALCGESLSIVRTLVIGELDGTLDFGPRHDGRPGAQVTLDIPVKD